MNLEIGNRAIILTHQGATPGPGVTCEEIRIVRRRFRRLFGVDPVITIRGRFGREAMMPKDATDSTGPDVWPIMNNPEPIVFVGREYVKIRFTWSQWKGRETLRVKPNMGVNVAVRFTLLDS